MASHKKYWKSEEELKPESAIVDHVTNNEFAQEIPVGDFLGNKANLEDSSASRRDFLKFLGFSTVAAGLAACEGPVKKTIPYVVQPEQIRPGVANYYATTMADGFDFANILVKTAEGRPVKIEWNKIAGAKSSGGGARIHASVLSLYDSLRLKSPKKHRKEISWDLLDSEILKAIESAKLSGKEVAILTSTLASPSTYQIINAFSAKFGNVSHVQYDAISEEAALNAFERFYGVRGLVGYDFSKADVIVSFGADFLGDWQGGGFEGGYAKGRIPKKGAMSWHIQFEANMTLSGANADKRVPLTVSKQKIALANFYAYLTDGSSYPGLSESENAIIKKAANRVKASGSKAVVVSGIQDENAQLLVLEINRLIASLAADVSSPLLTRQGRTTDLKSLLGKMNSGKVGVLIMYGVNPTYTLPDSEHFEKALKNVDVSVAFSMKEDETSSLTTYAAASPHYLESWGDVQINQGVYGFAQPTINPLFNTRQFQDALLKWVGSDKTYRDYLSSFWEPKLRSGFSWNNALHDGVYISDSSSPLKPVFTISPSIAEELAHSTGFKGFELILYTKTGIGDGQQANNPWLQEFPDPISRVSWDNYLTISKYDAGRLGLKNWHVSNGALNGSYALVSVNGVSQKLPVYIQPGQARGSLGVALGYGRTLGVKPEMQVGGNAYKFYTDFKNVQEATLSIAEGEHEFACIQLHNTLMGRGDIIKETSLKSFSSKPKEQWNELPQVSLDHKNVPSTTVSLWDEFDTSLGHHFNLSIDLNACTGCGACVIACHAENNVPVVGKLEVRKSRDMHWIRIDRYYSSEASFDDDLTKKENISGLSKSMTQFGELEDPSENPQVAFQPVMCQHCNHAPCETVCPVAATSHGHQGQNQMAYNRCVGTRYCANNCPYKVRRFNWFLYNNNDEFDYHMNDDLGKMVLNPDVVTRSRGVMEKCSMCIQMTQKTILDAKRDGKEIVDGDFKTACSSACTTNALVFGDINNKDSEVKKLLESDRSYHLLEHVGTKPNVFYHVKVRNVESV